MVMKGLVWLLFGLGTLMVTVFKFFVEFLMKKFSLSMVAVVAIIGLTVAFLGAVHLIIAGLQSIAPPELSAAASLVVPSNFPACLSAIFGTALLKFGYQLQLRLLGTKVAGVWCS